MRFMQLSTISCCVGVSLGPVVAPLEGCGWGCFDSIPMLDATRHVLQTQASPRASHGPLQSCEITAFSTESGYMSWPKTSSPDYSWWAPEPDLGDHLVT